MDVCCDFCSFEDLDVLVCSEDVFLAWHWDGVGHSGDCGLVVTEYPDVRCWLVYEFCCEVGCFEDTVEFCIEHFTFFAKVVGGFVYSLTGP
jgi:hypothetical protein